MAKKLNVGIVGCGAMGSQITMACLTRFSRSVRLSAICDKDAERISALSRKLGKRLRSLSLERLIRQVDLIIEASSASASAAILRRCIELKKSCLVMSVGGLLGREGLLRMAVKRGVKVYVPSGAIAGIDALKAASVGKVRSVTLTTRKPPKGLEGAPYLEKNRIDVNSLIKETVIFEGTATEAVRGFPANINVSAVLSMAGIGPKRTRVRIITSPEYDKNIHEIEIIGDSGRIVTSTENVPSVSNPKTSALAINSAIAAVGEIVTSVRIGT